MSGQRVAQGSFEIPMITSSRGGLSHDPEQRKPAWLPISSVESGKMTEEADEQTMKVVAPGTSDQRAEQVI
jgi:hypothetical protein